MLEASISALPGLIPVFLASVLLFGGCAAFLARAKKWPVAATTLWTASLTAVLVVTLLPGSAGDPLVPVSCNAGPSVRGMVTTASGRLNILLFVPLCFFGVLLFRRPLAVLTGGIALTGMVELLQALLPLGRACSHEDLLMNCAGGLLGTTLGTVWLRARQGRWPLTRRDGLLNGSLLALTTATLTATFHFAVPVVAGGAGVVAPTAEQEKWGRRAAADLYGPDATTVKVQLREGFADVPARVYVTTDQGSLTLTWPAKKLISAFSYNDRDDEGSLSPDDVHKAGEAFARGWYAEEVRGSEATLDRLGDGASKGSYMLSYRRYRDEVLMPMRLDITVSSAGRIMSVTALPEPDPALDDPELTREDAQQRAEEMVPGFTAGETFLMAQKTYDQWRPVWVVNLLPEDTQADEEDGATVHLDAISGTPVERQE
ncbi:VanZ family protein [Streptomyces sp. NPDC046924]|uniref:VanZ family protein n=1 Tax=Streptomyces sp. NPDC046924 TaxID=3155136 RepID=UPI0033E86B1D